MYESYYNNMKYFAAARTLRSNARPTPMQAAQMWIEKNEDPPGFKIGFFQEKGKIPP